MSYALQSYEDCTFVDVPELEPYRNCCDNLCFYPTVPMAQGTEFDVYPTVVYAVYPTVDMKDQELYPVSQQVSQPVVAENVYERGGDGAGVFFTSSPDIETKERYAVSNHQNLDESLTLSDCSPPEESEDKSASLLSSAFNNSFDIGAENTKYSSDSGYYGTNGCWYPSKNSSLDSGKNLIPSNDPESAGSPTSDSGKNTGIIPPSKLMMPKQLMSYYNYYQRLDLPSAALGRPHLVHTFPCDGNICVEDLWLAHMKLLFRNFPHTWNLKAAHSSRHFDKSWSSFKDMAKVRFYCQNCLDGWTSMFGVVVFYYSWSSELSCGNIRYQVSGQKCGKCNPDIFEMPLWYPEEAQKVITNLYYEIASRFYSLRTPQHIRTRRLGQPINQHNKSLCQGCTHGLCKPDGKLQGPDDSKETFVQSVCNPYHSLQSNSVESSAVAPFSSDTSYGCTPYSYSPHFPIATTYPSAVHSQQFPTTAPYYEPSVYQCPPVDMDISYPNYVSHVPNYVPQMAVYYPCNY